ncbi:MAG: tetratricopeptide repeat-containing protein [Planctomycetes bacterium]|nr:tetratricopeptide repeat-containing protein [Planctomycetota bacterium]
MRITGRGERHASVASAMNNLATACCRLGEFDRAEALLRSALAIHRECEWHGSVGQDLNNLGLLLVGRERFAEARTALDEALAIRSERLGPEHETVAQTSYALGMLAARQGDLETAADRFRQAAAIQERARPGFWHAADTRSRLGEILLELGRIDEARPLLEASAAALRTALGPDHEHTLEAEARLATLRSREASDR